MSIEVEDFLSHYGVKGQKWGVRRKSRRKYTGAAKKPAIGKRQHDARKLSNQELKRVVDRMELEQRYSKLNAPSASNLGRKFINDMISTNGGRIAGAIILTGASVGISRILRSQGHNDAAQMVRARLQPKK